MVAYDNAGNATSPVNFKTVDGRPVPDEPHIGSNRDETPKEGAVQTGFARGGTTRPTEGDSGKVEQLDNDGKVVKVHPGEVARIVREDGPHAGLAKIGGGTPPGDPEPSEGKSSKKKG